MKKYWDQSLSQLELCPCFTPRPETQPCWFSFLPTCWGWRKGGWRQGGSPALQLLPCKTANSMCCSVTQEGAAAQALESAPIPHHSKEWLHLTGDSLTQTPASCPGRGVRHYEAAGNSLHWALWLVFYLEMKLLQLTSHTTQLTNPQ